MVPALLRCRVVKWLNPPTSGMKFCQAECGGSNLSFKHLRGRGRTARSTDSARLGYPVSSRREEGKRGTQRKFGSCTTLRTSETWMQKSGRLLTLGLQREH